MKAFLWVLFLGGGFLLTPLIANPSQGSAPDGKIGEIRGGPVVISPGLQRAIEGALSGETNDQNSPGERTVEHVE